MNVAHRRVNPTAAEYRPFHNVLRGKREQTTCICTLEKFVHYVNIIIGLDVSVKMSFKIILIIGQKTFLQTCVRTSFVKNRFLSKLITISSK